MIVFICNMAVNKEILVGWANVVSRKAEKTKKAKPAKFYFLAGFA